VDATHDSNNEIATAHAPETVVLCWRSLPVVDDFPKSLLLVALVVVSGVGVTVAFDSVGLGVLAVVLLVMSVARYFYPTYYELSDAGVSVRSWLGRRQRPWDAFAGCYVHRVGVHLSPFVRPSALDPFRGTFVRFAGNGDVVVALVRQHVPTNETPGATPAPSDLADQEAV